MESLPSTLIWLLVLASSLTTSGFILFYFLTQNNILFCREKSFLSPRERLIACPQGVFHWTGCWGVFTRFHQLSSLMQREKTKIKQKCRNKTSPFVSFLIVGKNENQYSKTGGLIRIVLKPVRLFVLTRPAVWFSVSGEHDSLSLLRFSVLPLSGLLTAAEWVLAVYYYLTSFFLQNWISLDKCQKGTHILQ